jgi:hypothetical protein
MFSSWFSKDVALCVRDRHHGARQAGFARGQCTGLRQRRIGIAVRAAVAVPCGHQIGRPGRRHEADRAAQRLVTHIRGLVAKHRHTGHHLDAAGQRQAIGVARLQAGQIHRAQAGSAEPVDGDRTHVRAPACQQAGRLADVAALFAGLRHAAEDRVVYLFGVEARTLLQRAQGAGQQFDRFHAVKRTGFLGCSAWRSHRVYDVAFEHCYFR